MPLEWQNKPPKCVTIVNVHHISLGTCTLFWCLNSTDYPQHYHPRENLDLPCQAWVTGITTIWVATAQFSERYSAVTCHSSFAYCFNGINSSIHNFAWKPLLIYCQGLLSFCHITKHKELHGSDPQWLGSKCCSVHTLSVPRSRSCLINLSQPVSTTATLKMQHLTDCSTLMQLDTQVNRYSCSATTGLMSNKSLQQGDWPPDWSPWLLWLHCAIPAQSSRVSLHPHTTVWHPHSQLLMVAVLRAETAVWPVYRTVWWWRHLMGQVAMKGGRNICPVKEKMKYEYTQLQNISINNKCFLHSW